jgi:hypothetical protein
MVLKQGGSGGDAGAATEIPLDIACPTELGVCVATPHEQLRPNTTYAWSAAFADDPPEYGSRLLTFTTGARQEKSAFDTNALSIQLTGYRDPEPDAGGGLSLSSGTFTGKSGDLQRPAVLVVAGGIVTFDGPPLVFSSNETFDFSVYDIQDCATPAVVDFTGKRYALPEVCVDPKDRTSDSPKADATEADSSGSGAEGNAGEDAGANAPAAPPRLRGVDDDRGCAINAGVHGSSWGAWAWGVAILLRVCRLAQRSPPALAGCGLLGSPMLKSCSVTRSDVRWITVL